MVEVSYQTSGCSLNLPGNLLPWCDLVVKYAEEYKLDPYLVFAVVQQESGGNPNAINRKSGAVGLMQVMPRDGIAGTIMCDNGPCFADRPLTQELLNPELNIQKGCNILRGYIDKYGGSIRDGLWAYYGTDSTYAEYADIVLNIYSSLIAVP